jgi:hypothetical protein
MAPTSSSGPNRVRGAAVLDDPAVHDPIDVHCRYLDAPARRFDAQPFARVRAAHGHAADGPFAFRDLLLDRQVQVRVCLAHAADVVLRARDPHCVPQVVVDFDVLRRHEARDLVDRAGVHDLLVVAPDQGLVCLAMHGNAVASGEFLWLEVARLPADDANMPAHGWLGGWSPAEQSDATRAAGKPAQPWAAVSA